MLAKTLDGYLITVTLDHLKRNIKPDKFSKFNPYTIQNIKYWCKINDKPFELISKEYKNAQQKLKWQCLKPECGEVFEASWNSIQSNHTCGYCTGQRISLSNCLTTKNPELAKQWHPTLNGDLTPYDVTANSGKEVWWQCDKNPKHVWKTVIYSRNGNNRGCPYCAGFYASDDYNLLVCNPELCKEWDYIKNKKSPREYTPSNGEEVWWKCIKGHEWKSTIHNRSNHGCPYCYGRYATKENNLLIINPELCEEWDYTKNKKKPEEYTPYSSQKVWWKCKECGWEWKTIISHRNKGSGCPKCNESKGEKQLNYILSQHNIPHSSQYTFDNLVGIGGGLLRFDKSIFWDKDQTQLRMLIEYDGIQHFKWIKGWITKKQFKTLQIHDELKNQYCKNNNIKLLRIPYWDFDNIEKILKKEGLF